VDDYELDDDHLPVFFCVSVYCCNSLHNHNRYQDQVLHRHPCLTYPARHNTKHLYCFLHLLFHLLCLLLVLVLDVSNALNIVDVSFAIVYLDRYKSDHVTSLVIFPSRT
ncbi:hypothetical protein ALC56_14858, partial [Trachymyrmex septentrionalis]